jgi:predicted adenine nucleotide alpha hydrolase (AANH) superfamily ATPase
MNKVNYKKLMDRELEESGSDKTLLLHACCAPCSSACLTTLKGRVRIKVLYYNPNIVEDEEYELRDAELKRLITELKKEYPEAEIEFVEGKKEPEKFLEIAKGLEKEPEGGKRCEKCFELRLREAARVAKEEHADFFTTTLTISPLKNAELLNEIGERIAKEEGIRFLNSDFKKDEGYKRSVELSKKYGLYRQDYCGCPYSKAESIKRKQENIRG